MNAWKFSEEFTQLLCRWTRPVKNEDGTSAPLLTKLEIQEAIQNVHQAIFGVNPPVPDYSSVKTPATGIAVCTPSAPMVPKSSLDSANTSLGRYRSLDTLMTDDSDATRKIDNLASKSQEDMDIDEVVQIEPVVEEKKHISRSSPAIHVAGHANKVSRSDTFIREQEKAKANAEQAESSTIIENEQSVLELQRILKKIDELRECAANVVSRIDDVKKEVCPQSTKPRRLSSIGSFPGLGQTSSLLRPMPSSKMRRCTSGVPGTPTSTKLGTMFKAEKPTSTTRRTTVVISTERSPNSALKNRSPSVTPIVIKKSPCTTKNSKYAHVQSTIPKPTTIKRKAQ